MAGVRDIVVNLVASATAGVAVWLAQRLLTYRRLNRKRAFFGLSADADVWLVVSRHASSPHEQSVHRNDVAALVELTTVVKECGGRARLTGAGEVALGLGRLTEFCVGGPGTNPRTAVHLRAMLRGVGFEPFEVSGARLAFSVGSIRFERDPEHVEYAILARITAAESSHPVFVIIGQTANANYAAARYLATRHRRLHRQYGSGKDFCLVLRIVEPASYGADLVELAGDASSEAFRPPPEPQQQAQAQPQPSVEPRSQAPVLVDGADQI